MTLTGVRTLSVASSLPQPQPDAGLKSVLGKAQLILEAFTATDTDLSLSELVRRTGLAKATVHRLAQELLTWGLLERRHTCYRLGLRLFELGQCVPRQRILREAALPYMEDLLIATREAVHFAVHDGLEVLYVEKIVSHRGEAIRSRVAGRLPLHCTATGKVMLAFSPTTLLKDVVDEGLTALTRHTIMSPALLGKQLMKVRSEGLAVEVEEARVGYMSMAVPVFSGHSTLVGALSVTGPTARLNAHRLSPALRTAGHGIERTLQAMDRTQNQLKQNVRLPVCEPGHADASSVANSRRVH